MRDYNIRNMVSFAPIFPAYDSCRLLQAGTYKRKCYGICQLKLAHDGYNYGLSH